MNSILDKILRKLERFAEDRALAKSLTNSDVIMLRSNRDEYKYVENGKILLVYAELQCDNTQILIDRTSIQRWQPPYDGERISLHDQQRILKNICKHFDSQHITYIVEN